MQLRLKPKTISTVLSWVAVGGVGLTAFLSARAGRKAADKKTKKEKAINYIPAAVAGIGTCGCIMASNRVSVKEITALTATCGYLAANRDKIEKIVGGQYGKEVLEEIKKESGEKKPTIGISVEETGKGDELFFDRYSGRWFRSSIDAVCYAEEELNNMFKSGQDVCLNDFYYLLGISQTSFGWLYGFPANEDWFDYKSGIEFENSYTAPSPEHEADWVIDIYTYPIEAWYEA